MKKAKLLDTAQRNQTIAIVLNSDNKKKKTRSKKLLKKNQKRLKERKVLIINSDKKWKNEVEELEQEVDMQVSENDKC